LQDNFDKKKNLISKNSVSCLSSKVSVETYEFSLRTFSQINIYHHLGSN